MTSYAIAIGEGCWLADSEGDPGRTTRRQNAIIFDSLDDARERLKDEQLRYPRRCFTIEEVE